MFIFENFNANHIESAARLALSEYFAERKAISILPQGEYLDLFCNMISRMSDHKLGVVAIEHKKIVGFLTCLKPRDNHFGTTLGTFSPIHGHGAIWQGKKRLYSLLYQHAAEKWVREGILSHAIAVYGHDSETINSFFWNGFGLRTVDAIRSVEPIAYSASQGCSFCELSIEQLEQVVPFKNLVMEHLQKSPMFMPFLLSCDATRLKEEHSRRKARFFIASIQGNVIGFIEIMPSGENFVCRDPEMTNICGAYLMPQYRSKGVFTQFLSWLMDTLLREGYTRCGVDFESLNPMASGFWLKYFTAYTYGLVRRIDERIHRTL